MITGQQRLIATMPRWQQPAMRLLFALACRPRGIALLARLRPLDEAILGLLALVRYDDPARAQALGWDAEAVIARGREVRGAA